MRQNGVRPNLKYILKYIVDMYFKSRSAIDMKHEKDSMMAAFFRYRQNPLKFKVYNSGRFAVFLWQESLTKKAPTISRLFG